MTSSDTRIGFKYRSGSANTLDRDLESLQNSTFFAAVRSTLNDPFEGRFDRRAYDIQFSALKSLISGAAPAASAKLDAVSQAAEKVLEFVDKSGVFSLSFNPLQELMWAHYGGSHQGFCIGYEIETLVAFEPSAHQILDVQYSDEIPALCTTDLTSNSSSGLLRKMLGMKSKPWGYEEEVRIVTHPSLHEYDYRAVQVVYFGLRCAEDVTDSVMKALAGRGVRYFQVVSPPASYALKSKVIPDRYADAPKYLDNLAPIGEGAIYPDYLKPDQKQYTDYLYKAAEIVRREPYCQEVVNVDISQHKSAPGNPVIFVQYLRGPAKFVSLYLTLPEIERGYAALGIGNG
ncbi:hypothetical protein AVE30378_02203 [Achromobacter veterisilvae]|uniref:DUF2971 domain-containing protein n=1 Tax=Achromobacter veterisilvae TaxID=2069367 RepID=A0A446CFK0_9BURK|nr:DUF2971 domain-containing protein [Achromobacter veterisilvae]SSW66664.1 hypothetical protein AVE30378_02203 [Achromobacter veterisilvae]